MTEKRSIAAQWRCSLLLDATLSSGCGHCARATADVAISCACCSYDFSLLHYRGI